MLCSVHCLVSLALKWVHFWPSVFTAALCGWSSFSGLCWSFTCSCGGVVGHRFVGAAAPVCWAPVGGLLHRSVALGSCAPYPVGSSLEDSFGFMVQAPGVFLDSLLGFFPLTSSGYGWLGVVVACTSCEVPYLWLTLCSSACVGPGGCLSGCPCVFALGSSSLGLVCMWASTVSSSYVFLRDGVTLWVSSVFLSLLIANEGLHCWLFLSVLANPFWGCVLVFLRPPWVCRHFLWLVAALLPGFLLSFAWGLSSP